MRHFAQSITGMGRVVSTDPENYGFTIRVRSGDTFTCFVNEETQFKVLRNLDELDSDRFAALEGSKHGPNSPPYKIEKYLRGGMLISVDGIYQESGEVRRFDARVVHLFNRDARSDRFVFEETHWWLTQIDRIINQWLENLFGQKRSFLEEDFASLYRTNLNILGLPSDDNVQEMATLSRLIYGLSSAYLLTGAERYLIAARAGVAFQRQTFRYLSHDGQYCFWAFGRRRGNLGSRLIMPSENPDDRGTIPLYEQIYALCGLVQYYRITADWEVLKDIRRTLRSFADYYHDDEGAREKEGFPGLGGYFSHLDYATMRPDAEALGENRLRKNWNSIGDHIPAYLINLILALDPLPIGSEGTPELQRLLNECRAMLDETSRLIVEKFPDRNPEIPYVNERFLHDWSPDHNWGWQKNRAIIGHDLKISWNLTRAAKYYRVCALRDGLGGEKDRANAHSAYADRLIAMAKRLAEQMAERGYDQIRGGLYDAVEREPRNQLPIEFTWGDTKDFWQQEQAILAYLILLSVTDDDETISPGRAIETQGNSSLRADFLALSREMQAFWNLYFLDHDNCGIYFRVTGNGVPFIQGNYGNKAGHSTGYHAEELNFLAHIYSRAHAPKPRGADYNFCLYFRPAPDCRQTSINVLPDFFEPDEVEIVRISVRGINRPDLVAKARDFHSDTPFQILLQPGDLGSEIVVEFCGYPKPRSTRSGSK